MRINIVATDGAARALTIELPHGSVETPVFMPVATLGAVRALPFERVAEMGYSIILSNAYHLYLRPGDANIAALGGLHRFTNWPKNILTDSGGFQLFSLQKLIKVRDEGIEFQSHIDGSRHYFTPEAVVGVQQNLGSDIIMPLDSCTPADIGYLEARRALTRTSAWLKRSIAALTERHTSAPQHLFAIVQGNFYPTLRRQSALESVECDLPGYAIGGLSVGEEESAFIDMLAHTAQFLPEKKPRYLMGIGTPSYFLRAVAHGIDMVDCVYPTRVARHGMALTHEGAMNMRHARFRLDTKPLEEECACRTCQHYTRAYISHLCRQSEIMAMLLLCEHNLFFMERMCRDARAAIKEGRYALFARQFLDRYSASRHSRVSSVPVA